MKITVNIRDFGAVANGELQTRAIQDAIDRVFSAGGGEVVIPEGVFMTGSIRLRSNITLHLLEGATLKGSQNPEDYFACYVEDKVEPLSPERITDAPYVHLGGIFGETHYDEHDLRYRFRRLPGSRWNNALIRAIDAENVAIVGEKDSFIDGNNCFDEIGEEYYRGPHAITFFNCKSITFKGYTVRDSANWAHNMLFCENISMEQVKVLAGHDGFDAFTSSNITIKNCEFYTGDDCVAGFGNVNVLVADSVLNSSCSAMRFGGTNVLVRNCKIYGPGEYFFRGRMTPEDKRACKPSPTPGRNMLSAFTYYADYSMPIPEIPSNIVIKDCTFKDVDRFLHYNFSGNETWQRYRPMADITFENIKATDIGMALNAYGREDSPLELRLENVEISVREGAELDTLVKAAHCKRVVFDNVKIESFGGESLILTKTDGEFVFNGVDCSIDEANYVKRTEETFKIQTV
ncbi:MAG: right-handed parallel beta-helix repeat-containing protein [Clostridia bacterium]|nr:right-handed parallel beta-helix repeat-containing protein [Clostridia bacterium]